MKPKPSLIPRFNLDYNFIDLCYGVTSTILHDKFDLKPLELIFGRKKFLFTSYGRSALYVILRALNLPKGSKIGVPLYSCTVVFDAIIKAGHSPCFIDIDLSNYTMDPGDLKEKIEDLSAIVVIHTFGRPADLATIKEIAGDRPVIEDCAHALLSEYSGKKIGTIGDVSFFSLAKYLSAGGGGMIIVNNDGLTSRLQEEIDALKEPSFLNNLGHAVIVYMRSFFYHKPWFGLFALSIGLSIEDKVDLTTKKSFVVAGINKNDLTVMLKKLDNFKINVEKQRSNSLFLIDELKNTRLVLPCEKENTLCNYYLFPLRFENKEKRDFASDFLRGKGIDTSKLYSETPFKATQYYGYAGDCPDTEKLVDTILAIPNYYTLRPRELSKITESVKVAAK